MGRLWRNYNLGWVLLALFLVSWMAQGLTGWREYVSEQGTHQEAAAVFGSDGYIWRFLDATFENWQSEFLQLLTFVVLTSFLIFRGSHESKDSDEEFKALLLDIRERVSRIEGGGLPSGDGAGGRGGARASRSAP